MLRDRHCLNTNCLHEVEDLLEYGEYQETVTCPKCENLTFRARAARTYFRMDGCFADVLDRNREAAAAGWGNESLKM